jgi:hypothetical protein
MIASINASLLLILANITSSNKNGAHNAMANGHPTMPPIAYQMTACVVFKPPRQFIKAAIPSMVVYIAKLEGRKAADAWNIPGLNTITMRKNRAILGFKMLLMMRKNCVSQIAQMNARAYRMK